MPSQRALQLHSLTLNDEIDTWDDWGIVATKRPVFNEPELRSEYMDVPGRNGQLDMTEVLTGYPLFENRTGSLEFFLYDDSTPVLTKLNVIRNYLHGKRHKIILNDEPEYYYAGRLMVHESHPTTEGEYAVFELEYNLEPYKYELTSSVEDWLWDPFNFETGVIREYERLLLSQNTPRTVTVTGSRKPTPLKVILSLPSGYEQYSDFVAVTLSYNDETYNLTYGTNVLPMIMLQDDEYEFTFELTGQISDCYLSIDFRGGIL